MAKAKVVGTVGLVMDQEMRAEYFAAVRMLDDVPLLTAVRYFLSHRPVGLAATPLVEARQTFLQDKRRTGRAERTIKSLRVAEGQASASVAIMQTGQVSVGTTENFALICRSRDNRLRLNEA